MPVFSWFIGHGEFIIYLLANLILNNKKKLYIRETEESNNFKPNFTIKHQYISTTPNTITIKSHYVFKLTTIISHGLKIEKRQQRKWLKSHSEYNHSRGKTNPNYLVTGGGSVTKLRSTHWQLSEETHLSNDILGFVQH